MKTLLLIIFCILFNPVFSQETMDYYKYLTDDQKEKIAEEKDINKDFLKKILYESEGVQRSVALNPKTNPNVLRELIKDSSEIKRLVCKNKGISPLVLEEIFFDICSQYIQSMYNYGYENYIYNALEESGKYKLKESEKNYSYLKKQLDKDFESIMSIFLKNQKSEDAYKKMFIVDQEKNSNDNVNIKFLEQIARNKNTPSYILKILSCHPDEYVRGNVAKNPNTPISTIKKLYVDEDDYVKKAAKKILLIESK